ncbi:MAG: polysaccharide biosynthesis/export family protein [Candidatus Sulfotelmatobacter sp.]
MEKWLPRPFAASKVHIMRELTLAMLLLGLTAIGGWAQNQHLDQSSADESGNTIAASPNNQKISVTMSTVSPEPPYVIGIDDILHIAVWKEPDLTSTLPVRSDGMISVPLLNDVQAAGLTPMQLAALLTQKLRKYVAVPNVTVVVTQTNSHRIYVIGEVLRTGPMSLLHNLTVLQALATAGFTQFANTKGIYVLRAENGQEKRIPFDYKRVIKGEVADQNILLKPGDTIVVP